MIEIDDFISFREEVDKLSRDISPQEILNSYFSGIGASID